MGESELHHFLKYVGMAYLHNQGCILTATEVYLRKPMRNTLTKEHEKNNKHIIDVVGWGEKPIFEKNKYGWKSKAGSIDILRGIEVKVSRSDFLSGFASTGCNYHYVLAPMKLISKDDLPSWVGLIEFNKYKFKCDFWSTGDRFSFDGVRTVKRPKFIELDKRYVNSNTWKLAKRANRLLLQHVTKEINDTLSSHVYEQIPDPVEELESPTDKLDNYVREIATKEDQP